MLNEIQSLFYTVDMLLLMDIAIVMMIIKYE